MLTLVVFLGNPGAEYSRNRHNVGRMLAENLSFYGDLVWKKKFRSLVASLTRKDIAGRETLCSPEESSRCHFLIPETYMNLSGLSVQAASSFYDISPNKILAVHDELELPLGYLSLKFSGGLGGHNGLRSIKESLGSAGSRESSGFRGTADFWRLRIGIGRPQGRLPGEGGQPVKGVHEGGDGRIAQWVLSNFDSGETELVNAVLKEGALFLVRALLEEPEKLLPEWKKKKIEL